MTSTFSMLMCMRQPDPALSGNIFGRKDASSPFLWATATTKKRSMTSITQQFCTEYLLLGASAGDCRRPSGQQQTLSRSRADHRPIRSSFGMEVYDVYVYLLEHFRDLFQHYASCV